MTYLINSERVFSCSDHPIGAVGVGVDRIENLLETDEQLKKELDDALTRKYSLWEHFCSIFEYCWVFTVGKYFDTQAYRNYLIAYSIVAINEQKRKSK